MMQSFEAGVQEINGVGIRMEPTSKSTLIGICAYRLSGSLLYAPGTRYAICMQRVADVFCQRNKPGPQPVFTDRLVTKVRPDQTQALNRLASMLDVPVSQVVRWILDNGIAAIETAWKDNVK